MSSEERFSIIASEARISDSARIGAFTRIHPNVVIEEGVEIGDHCVLWHPSSIADGSPLVIRRNSIIRSHSVFYEGSSFGEALVTGHRVTVREGTVAGGVAIRGLLEVIPPSEGLRREELLPLGSPQEVREACRQNIADANGRGYFLGSSTELHWGVKLENAIAMYETPGELEGKL